MLAAESCVINVKRGESTTGVEHTEVNHELENLETSDPFLPPNADSTRALEVVPVHDNMDHEVERDWDP